MEKLKGKLECDLILEKIRKNAMNQLKSNIIEHPYSKEQLWKWFLCCFNEIHSKPFQYTKEYMHTNYAAVFKYFLNDKSFFNCPNLYKHKLAPNFNKGLMIVGKVGLGKTHIMQVFEKLFHKYKPNSFKIIETYSVVEEYESLKTPKCKQDFYKRYSQGTLLFDDLNSERIANNFGKVNVMKEIIFRRHNNGCKTHFTMNPFPGLEESPLQNLLQLQDFYDARIADRLFEMCNYITIRGKSKRV